MKAITCVEIMVLFLIGTGCATYGEIEESFGKSYAMSKKNQILNPDASKNLKPEVGLSGIAAEANMNKYADSFSNGGKLHDTAPKLIVPLTSTESGGTGKDGYDK